MLADPSHSIAAYHELRLRLTDLLGAIDPAEGDLPVPACPAWTVTDVVAHLTGVCVDIIDGNLEGVGTAPWADQQAERLAPLGIPGLLERWSEVGPQVEALAPAFPAAVAAQFVFDATTHEHDLRGSLGRPGARDAESVKVSLGFLENMLDGFVRTTSAPTLEIRMPGRVVVAGEGEPEVVLTCSAFEVLRSFGGRRSADQFRALDWRGEPEPYLGVFDLGPLRLRDEPLEE